jgi:predicted lipoprotein with Yx(FWY)xxD motif
MGDELEQHGTRVTHVVHWEVTPSQPTGEVIMSRTAFTVRLLGATATLMLAAACGTSTATTPSSGSTPAKSASGDALGVATTSLGPVLVNSKGFTVYMLTADSPGHSTCSSMCLQYWQPVPGPAGSSSAKGISAALATTKATNGASMVTAAGWPLYTFVKDQAPGDVTGEGVKSFGGTWHAVTPAGAAAMAPATKAPATSSPASSGNGY